MADKLPDELIKEILSPFLRVPEGMFADMGSESVFCRFEISTLTILLVCKRWLRVATPLLYEVVILRSKAQAHALAGVLKANKAFGAFIKKLRVEGGYGAPMHQIITAAPNIKDLNITPEPEPLAPSLGFLDPSYIPFASASDAVQDQIWTRILSFAMQIEFRDRELSEVDIGTLHKAHTGKTSVALMRVSKMFHRLSLPLLYGYPIFYTIYSFQAFAASLVANPSLGSLVRSLPARTSHLGHDTRNMQVVLSRTPPLERLYAPDYGTSRLICLSRAFLDIHTFVMLVEKAGSTLVTFRNLEVSCDYHELPGTIFGNFKSLRSLEWMSRGRVSTATPSSSWLSTLETLKLSEFSHSFWKIISVLELPSLICLEIAFSSHEEIEIKEFFSVHGSKLRDLKLRCYGPFKLAIFDLCPHLTSVTLHNFYQSPQSSVFQCETDHKHLEKVIIPKSSGYSVLRDQEWATLFAELDLSMFSHLKEMQIDGCEWPTNERGISKNPWPRWAEETKDKWNVTITDGQGRAWKPRLKIRK
ncbi:hypothetical protein JAAARDRAFT_191498 [Jaapia argillacea MUCL 33604]|uniref:F-box domain-containing protein n=1 Tax=Jaapia argillacea MUCL 33604 TaxID=933084 RepID=A0A067Q999_9AGAM|nr:hypothetical protein JAAARDRAFT_191498 [Jaapia argillacea MUCL 33604]